MIFLRTLTFLLLCISSALACAAEQTSTPILGLVNASQDRSENRILEFWGYHEYDGLQNYADTLKLRYYNPLNIGDWHGTLRLDTAYTAAYGPLLPAQSTGTYSANNAMVTIWGGKAGWFGNVGARVVVPLSDVGQWLAGPQVSTSFTPAGSSKSLLADISPLARYMIGFNAKAPSGFSPPPLASRLELYPTVGVNLGPSTQIRFWDENGAVYNAAGGGWFVPIDAMVTQRINKNLLLAIGGAKQVVQTYQLYNWTVYGKVSLTF
ncbi:hypothetical protein [Polynucleobacter yangtzensis]|uniref:MetA-pathway of phenol degradation n=1 Tax=Polynucleobacter yangtzensis TaxID=1743159 RepID=A0ABM8CKY5_9BURK|nr:hypothetical protein [Polynucleobacter yangtzensis]BDT78493.1 hypothetical protein PKF032_03810 [Polynucleobacter yangtzensis]